MDELEMKEELEQEAVAEEIEETVEEEISETEEMKEFAEETTVKQEKGSSNILGIIVGLVLFVAFLAVVWMSPVGNSMKDTGVLYAKDNDLYFYDLKNEPYLLQEGISAGGGYHYFYSAWGAEVTKSSDWVYYTANIDATGAGDLYRSDAKVTGNDVHLIDSNVYDYQTSEDGKVVAYLAMKEDSLELRYSEGGENWVAAEGMHLEDNGYSLSADGKYLVYKDAYDMLCAKTTDSDETATKLTDDCPLYTLAEDTLYFVSKVGSMYNIYSYDFKNEPVLVAENAQYMELMPNGRDLLYGMIPAEVIPYSVLIEDDMAEADAALKEGDEGYEEKLQRDKIREAMENGEGLQPMLMEYYLLSNGKTTLMAENVISAVAVDHRQNYITGYKAIETKPIQMSMLSGGLEMVEMIYYMSLNYGGMEVFLADGRGNMEVLAENVQPESIQISKDGSRAAYLVTDMMTGGNVLMQMEIGKAAEAAVVQMNVEDFAFIGGNGPLCYYYDYANGVGTLASVDSERTITDAAGVQFADDVKEVYYIANISSTTGVGQMQHWNGEDEPTIVDGGIFAFQYKGNGKAALIYDYDVVKQTGDFGYYDGKGVTMLDEDITAIFMY